MKKFLEKAKGWLKPDNDQVKENHAEEETKAEELLQVKKESKLRELLGYAAYYVGPHRKYILAGSVSAVVLMAFCLLQVFSYGYRVSVDGEPLFTVTDREMVVSLLNQAEAEMEERVGFDLDFSSALTIEKAWVKTSAVFTAEDIDRYVHTAMLEEVNAAAIVIDGQPQIYVATHQAADRVLAQLKMDASVVGDDEVLKDVFLKEDISIADCRTPLSNLVSVENALEMIRTGEEKPVVYTIESGDTLWTIARKNDVLVEDITLMNGIDPNAILSIGQEIILSRSEPLISVVAEVECTKTETIPFETELKEDNSVNGIKIAQEGENGEKIVSYSTIRVNGITTEKNVIAETITKEAQNRIVLRGSQITTASRGFTRSSGMYLEGVHLTYPTQGVITQYFGRHTGLDIASRIGTPIAAAESGIVTYVHYSNYSYGNYAVIDHLNGMVTRYAHCDELFVEVGQEVSAGQLIATMGNTGNSTGPHLHFEVLINGSFVNPLSYL